MSSNSTYIGAVEIGTSKVTVLVGEYNEREFSIIGCGECSSRGVVKGGIVDFRAASDCTHSALDQAERQARERIDVVFLAQSGGHLEGFYNEASVNVESADNMIEPSDLRRVCDLAKRKELPAGRVLVQQLRRPYRIDGRVIADPKDLRCQRIEVGYWTVHGQEQRVGDMLNVIRGFNLDINEVVLSSLASGHMVTTGEERQHGVLVLDIGAGTTDYVLYRDGVPHLTGVVAVGGAHLTNDLAIGLRLTEGQAEKLKLRYGRANVVTKDRNQKVWLDGNFAIGDRQFSQHAIEQITAARVQELLEVVKKKLGVAFAPEFCATGVVLTGGTSKLPGIVDAAARVFDVPAHAGEAPTWINENLRDPGYHTALGLLYCGIASQSEQAAVRRRGGFFSGMKRLFSHA